MERNSSSSSMVAQDDVALANEHSSTHPVITTSPEVEVVALPPESLLTSNRFICNVCNKGFRRNQNLQLHRRGHNLPFQLKKNSRNEVMKKQVYICPETDCMHHNPTRALGDLSGLKKHFNRKHGQKKFNCERCSKKYGVLSDLKVHIKTCGVKRYSCDCGLTFTRRDSLTSHRAFCEALGKELNNEENIVVATANSDGRNTSYISGGNFSSNTGVDASIYYVPSIPTGTSCSTFRYPGLARALLGSGPHPIDPMTTSLASPLDLSFPAESHEHYSNYSSSQLPPLSANALLQKPAQIGPKSSGVSALQNFGFSGSVPFNPQNENETLMTSFSPPPQPLWDNHVELEDISVESGLEMGLHTAASLFPNNFLMGSSELFLNDVGTSDFMIEPSAMFSYNKTTPDNLLGLTIGAPEEPFASDGLSSLFGLMGSQFGVGVSSLACGMGSAGSDWGVPPNKKRPLQ